MEVAIYQNELVHLASMAVWCLQDLTRELFEMPKCESKRTCSIPTHIKQLETICRAVNLMFAMAPSRMPGSHRCASFPSLETVCVYPSQVFKSNLQYPP